MLRISFGFLWLVEEFTKHQIKYLNIAYWTLEKCIVTFVIFSNILSRFIFQYFWLEHHRDTKPKKILEFEFAISIIAQIVSILARFKIAITKNNMNFWLHIENNAKMHNLTCNYFCIFHGRFSQVIELMKINILLCQCMDWNSEQNSFPSWKSFYGITKNQFKFSFNTAWKSLKQLAENFLRFRLSLAWASYCPYNMLANLFATIIWQSEARI